MSEQQVNKTAAEIAFCSSLDKCRWRNQPEPHAFERWHFDALSDDGRESLVIGFHDNYALSPRYFRQLSANGSSASASKKFPAVSFVYAVDGKTIMRTVNEFAHGELRASDDDISCSIGNSSFRMDAASYGSGFVLSIDLLTSRRRKIKGEFEWLSVEADLSDAETVVDRNNPCWNIASPRSDVSGRITLLGNDEDVRRLVHFRGTGYHDHFQSGQALTETFGSRYWGRAHFTDSTVIFHCYEIGGDDRPSAKIFLIRDGNIDERDAAPSADSLVRTGHGFRLPKELSLSANDDIQLSIKPLHVIQTGFFESRILGEICLVLGDGKQRKTIGITELVTPRLMRSRFLRWVTDLRIGKNGKGPLY